MLKNKRASLLKARSVFHQRFFRVRYVTDEEPIRRLSLTERQTIVAEGLKVALGSRSLAARKNEQLIEL